MQAPEYVVQIMVSENTLGEDNLTRIKFVESLNLGKFASLADAIDYMCAAHEVIERMHQ